MQVNAISLVFNKAKAVGVAGQRRGIHTLLSCSLCAFRLLRNLNPLAGVFGTLLRKENRWIIDGYIVDGWWMKLAS